MTGTDRTQAGPCGTFVQINPRLPFHWAEVVLCQRVPLSESSVGRPQPHLLPLAQSSGGVDSLHS